MRKLLAFLLLEGVIVWLLHFLLGDLFNLAPNITSLIILFINTMLGFGVIQRRFSDCRLRTVNYILIGFCLRVFLILWDFYGTNMFILPNSHSDTESFHRHAVLAANYGTLEDWYSMVVSIVYRLFGEQRVTAQYLNLVFSMLTIDILYRIMNFMDIDQNIKETILCAFSLLPNYAIVSIILLRECLISLLITYSLFMFFQWWKKPGRLYWITAVALSIIASQFHSGAIAAALAYLVITVLSKRDIDGVNHLQFSFSMLFKAAIIAYICAYAYTVLQDSLFGRLYVQDIDSLDNYFVEHSLYTQSGDTSSHYGAGINGLSGITNLLVNTPIRIFYYLLAPVPWNWRGLSDVFAFIFSSFFYFHATRTAVIALKKNGSSILTALLIICVASAVVFAWGVESAGTALRHRVKFSSAFFLLFAVGKNQIVLSTEYVSKREYNNAIR